MWGLLLGRYVNDFRLLCRAILFSLCKRAEQIVCGENRISLEHRIGDMPAPAFGNLRIDSGLYHGANCETAQIMEKPTRHTRLASCSRPGLLEIADAFTAAVKH